MFCWLARAAWSHLARATSGGFFFGELGSFFVLELFGGAKAPAFVLCGKRDGTLSMLLMLPTSRTERVAAQVSAARLHERTNAPTPGSPPRARRNGSLLLCFVISRRDANTRRAPPERIGQWVGSP